MNLVLSTGCMFSLTCERQSEVAATLAGQSDSDGNQADELLSPFARVPKCVAELSIAVTPR
jgi:hypothetical protein